MSKCIIFVFSGTGNSLWVAKEISKELPNCDIVSMGSSKKYSIANEVETIGFVYPIYGGAMPLKVKEFVAGLDLRNSKISYTFAIANCGNIARGGNSTLKMDSLLKRKGIGLNLSAKLDMFSNYVPLYDMKSTVKEEAIQSEKDLKPIIKMIKSRENSKVAMVFNPMQNFVTIACTPFVRSHDKCFNVSVACTKCGICKKVCPVNNIEYNKDRRPVFKHHCEQCVACLQNCPTKAINYKNKTQNRGRYIHPNISWKELAELNGAL